MSETSRRPIPAALSIQLYFHCAKCLAEKPESTSPKDWTRMQIGFTPIGVQVWCDRHECNVAHIDFEGCRHPANLKPEDSR